MTANTIPPLSVWPSCPPFLSSFGNTQEGPSRLRSAPITDPLSRGFGIPNRSPDPLAQRAGRDHPLIPFRYPKKSTGIQPHPVGPCVPHDGTPVAPRRRRVEYQGEYREKARCTGVHVILLRWHWCVRFPAQIFTTHYPAQIFSTHYPVSVGLFCSLVLYLKGLFCSLIGILLRYLVYKIFSTRSFVEEDEFSSSKE